MDERYAGYKARCPRCQRVLDVPASRSSAPTVAGGGTLPAGAIATRRSTPAGAIADVLPARGPASGAPPVRPQSSSMPFIIGGIGVAAGLMFIMVIGGLWWWLSSRSTRVAQQTFAVVDSSLPPQQNWPPRRDDPDVPRRPAFDDKLAASVALKNDKFETRGRFDDSDPADRSGGNPAKIYLIKLDADQAYLGELSFSDAIGDPQLRIEDRSGRTMTSASRRFGQGPANLIFVPAKTDTYRLVASTQWARGDFALSLRRVEEGDPLPDLGEGGNEGVPTRSMQQAKQLTHSGAVRRGGSDHFLHAAIAPDSRSAWVSWPDKGLELFSCPDFDTKANYKLPRRSYRIAVDGRGMLYAVAQSAETRQPALPWWDFGLADLEIYDTSKFDKAGTLTPTKTIPVHGVIPQLCMSPDDNWMYYLDAHNRKVGRVNLKEGKLDGETDQIVPDTLAMCLTPNGKKLYTCSKSNAVQILDPATLKIEKTIRFHEANPTGIQATDTGYVFLNSGNGQWTHIYLLYAARDYKEERAKVIPWAGVYHTNSLALSPDQQCLYASCFNLSPSNITGFAVSARPTMTKGRQCASFGMDGVNSQGNMIISRDGKFMFSDRGLIISLGR
jgi:hypothetical protein